jgi:hypothetical protein
VKLSQLTSKKWAIVKAGGWLAGRSVVAIPRAFIAQGQLYNVKKHSTRSKYRGYYIVQLKGSIISNEIKIAKNLTKPQAVAWIQLLKG